MASAGRLFVQKCEPYKHEGKWIIEQPVAHVLNDMFQRVATLREVNAAFYIACLDIWPALQEEFVKSMAAFIKLKPDLQLRMPVDCVAEIMKVLDPSLSRNLDAAADALRLTFHEKVKRHLRYHSAIQLMILFSNDITIIANNLEFKGFDKTTVPTLSGFAAYLNEIFGSFISQSIKDDERNTTISLFYESEAPAWNMLPDEDGTKNLQEYLDSISVKNDLSKLMPAPADLLAGAWPSFPEIGSLNTYVFGDMQDEEKPMPLIRMMTLQISPTLKLVAEIILPMRLLLAPIRTVGQTVWTPQYDCYAMNITTDMLAQSTWRSEMPEGFLIRSHQVLNFQETTISPQYQWLPDDSPLTGPLFKIWADVMLTWSAHNGFDYNNSGDPYRKRMEELPLLRYCVLVANALKNIFPEFYRDIYVDANVHSNDVRYEDSPIQKDWGTTSWVDTALDQFSVDAEFTNQFSGAPSSRKSWSTTSFFDMSLSFMEQNNGLNAEYFDPQTVFTASNIRGTIWAKRLYAEDIAPLMKNANLWSRHMFPEAEKVVARQHALLTQANAPAVAQASRRPTGRPRGKLVSINQICLERRRAGFLQ